MTKDDIIRMAHKAGLQPYYDEQEPAIERFAHLVAAAEREACAKVCEAKRIVKGGEVFAAAIRTRGAQHMTGFDSKRNAAQAKLEPTPWRDMVVATLVREGVNKHKARELADHFAVQPEQEPVAKVVSTAPDKIWLDLGFDPQDETEVLFDELHDVTWSGDNASGHGIEYVRTTPPAAQPEQEPVAYYHPHKGFYWAKPTHISAPTVVDVPPVPLFVKWIAAQRPWVGLETEEILDLFDRTNVYGSKWIEFARTVETKLKEKNGH